MLLTSETMAPLASSANRKVAGGEGRLKPRPAGRNRDGKGCSGQQKGVFTSIPAGEAAEGMSLQPAGTVNSGGTSKDGTLERVEGSQGNTLMPPVPAGKVMPGNAVPLNPAQILTGGAHQVLDAMAERDSATEMGNAVNPHPQPQLQLGCLPDVDGKEPRVLDAR